MWTFTAICRDRAINELGIGGSDRRIVEAEFLHDGGGEVFDDNVGSSYQRPCHLARSRVCQVERNVALIPVEAQKSSTLSTNLRMFVSARVVATFRVFDLDDLGTKIGKRLCTGGPRHDPREVNDQEAIQRGW